jgi:hypothetical protein
MDKALSGIRVVDMTDSIDPHPRRRSPSRRSIIVALILDPVVKGTRALSRLGNGACRPT